jgi:exopolyphosphatase/guanosine-5'-triphosphate,3'-diphosphate pyrophosphatase
MTIPDKIPQYDDQHYAVVDLGSNSFHLLIVRLNDGKIEKVNNVKRKVRLAAGLNDKNELSIDAINRGIDCIHLFAKHLTTILPNNIRIVATATLRIANNRDEFVHKANKILPVNINLLSGEQEAETIYSGVAHTCQNSYTKARLVIDIGGASTELIIGQNFTANKAISLNIGCVSFKEKYFEKGQLSEQNFSTAINAATHVINPTCADFISLGWQLVVGSSGTMRALTEILAFRQQPIIITYPFLQEIKQALILCKTMDDVTNDIEAFKGIRADRIAVLASGLSILIALFNCLDINELKLSKGALREGLLFEMLPSQK